MGDKPAVQWAVSYVDGNKEYFVKTAPKRDLMLIQGVVGASAFLTRPNDTTAYAGGDEISTNTTAGSAAVFEFKNAARLAGGLGSIRFIKIGTNNIAANLPVGLSLFTVAPTLAGDNAAFVLAEADYPNVIAHRAGIGTIAGASNGTLIVAQAPNATVPVIDFSYKCAPAATSLYGLLIASSAYTPAANQNFYITLGVERF